VERAFGFVFYFVVKQKRKGMNKTQTKYKLIIKFREIYKGDEEPKLLKK